ncbi:MAG: GNAT family N-acetyltransferase [Bacteroidota bacterium]
MTSTITLRPASLKDLPLLQYWDTKQHVIDCDPDEDWHWEEELRHDPPWRDQFVAELNGEPLGFLQIIDAHEEETHYWGEVAPHTMAIDIWIGEEENLNKGYGTIMMQIAIERCFQDPRVHTILIDPLETNTKAHRFYERLGFKFVGKQYFGGVACFVYKLNRTDVDE